MGFDGLDIAENLFQTQIYLLNNQKWTSKLAFVLLAMWLFFKSIHLVVSYVRTNF